MITSCGGQVSWDVSVGLNPPFPESDETINYQITDRPAVSNRVLGRTYVQPQWVADCINARKIVKASIYEPGSVLPPHLSPFVEVKEGDYVPETGLESDVEEEVTEEVSAEEKPKKTKKRTAAEIEEEEMKEMSTVMMTNKQRKLYTKMQYGIQQKADEKTKLENKKKALKKSKK
jgi:pescadillo protein